MDKSGVMVVREYLKQLLKLNVELKKKDLNKLPRTVQDSVYAFLLQMNEASDSEVFSTDKRVEQRLIEKLSSCSEDIVASIDNFISKNDEVIDFELSDFRQFVTSISDCLEILLAHISKNLSLELSEADFAKLTLKFESLEERAIRQDNLIDLIEAKLNKQVQDSVEKYRLALEEIQDKQNQINDILGHVSGRAIAGDYEKSAKDERRSANMLRYSSLVIMLVIVFIVAATFYQTTSESFEWESALVRIILAVILSVPAAYLARESSKHREQQYTHLQTALDLKAITPYIASLPESEQHRIKIEIAGRLFAPKDFSKVSSDPYPVNTNEIIIELLKKLDTKKDT